MPDPLRPCDSCGDRQAVYHVSLSLEVFGPQRSKHKRAQFHLCPRCELALAQVLSRDDLQPQRLALRLTENSAYMSRTREWQAIRPP